MPPFSLWLIKGVTRTDQTLTVFFPLSFFHTAVYMRGFYDDEETRTTTAVYQDLVSYMTFRLDGGEGRVFRYHGLEFQE